MRSSISSHARRGGLSALALAAVLTVFAPALHAAPAVDTEGYVVTLDGTDVVVDIGSKKGAVAGDVVELWRPLKLKHPVTGKIVTDRFRIGSLRLTQVRAELSLAQPDGALARPVGPGDVIVLRGTGIAPPPVVPTKPSTKPAPPVASGSVVPMPPAATTEDPEGLALTNLFDNLRGASIETRIAAYQEFAKSWPKGRYRKVLEEESVALHAALTGAQASPTGAGEAPKEGTPVALSFDPPGEVLSGMPVSLAIEVAGEVGGVMLQLRTADETAYQPITMTKVGPRYYRVVIPKERVKAPILGYFIEAVLPNGATSPLEGSAGSNRTIKVVDAPRVGPPTKWLSMASVWTDWADYNRLRNDDMAVQTEGFFGMRFRDVGLRAVRSGFGVYRGKGGSIDELDVKGLAPRSIGLSYGYVEGEWGITPFWGLAGRAVVGLTEEGVTGGAQAFVRIGNDRKTNLTLGGEILGGVGLRGITQFELNVFPRFPILFRSEVTNQPAGVAPSAARKAELGDKIAIGTADLGVRAIFQVGFRATPWLTLFARGSYQGRTINHAGPGAGAGVMVEW